MPIEFRCSQCGRLLRTGDDTSGKQAKCPECGAVLPIPEATAPGPAWTLPPEPPAATGSPFAPGGDQTTSGGDAENPYVSPTEAAYGPAQPFGQADPLAAGRVSGPATALIVTGALGGALQALAVMINIVQLAMVGNAARDEAIPMMLGGGIGVGLGIFQVMLAVVIVLGAIKMKNLESYGFAMASAIIAMIPCISPCCLLGFPFGIWALVVLNDAGVKAAFRS